MADEMHHRDHALEHRAEQLQAGYAVSVADVEQDLDEVLDRETPQKEDHLVGDAARLQSPGYHLIHESLQLRKPSEKSRVSPFEVLPLGFQSEAHVNNPGCRPTFPTEPLARPRPFGGATEVRRGPPAAITRPKDDSAP